MHAAEPIWPISSCFLAGQSSCYGRRHPLPFINGVKSVKHLQLYVTGPIRAASLQSRVVVMVEDISFHLPLTLTKSLSESTCEIIISNDSLVLAESNMEGGYYNNDTVRKANIFFLILEFPILTMLNQNGYEGHLLSCLN